MISTSSDLFTIENSNTMLLIDVHVLTQKSKAVFPHITMIYMSKYIITNKIIKVYVREHNISYNIEDEYILQYYTKGKEV